MGNTLNMSFADYASTTWDFLFTRNHRTPDTELPVKPVDLSHLNNIDSHQLNVTWLGHSSLMINIDGYKILTDPVFEKRVSKYLSAAIRVTSAALNRLVTSTVHLT
jgi:hypothetical protein